jgi:hypothetical protein
VPDRLLRHSTIVSIKGEGYRLKDNIVFLIPGLQRNSIGASVVSSPISRDAARRPSADGYDDRHEAWRHQRPGTAPV